MRDTQPPITSAAEYHGYQQAYETMTLLVAEREQRLFIALANGDSKIIEDRRAELLHVLRRREGIIDAIKVYEQLQKQSA